MKFDVQMEGHKLESNKIHMSALTTPIFDDDVLLLILLTFKCDVQIISVINMTGRFFYLPTLTPAIQAKSNLTWR